MVAEAASGQTGRDERPSPWKRRWAWFGAGAVCALALSGRPFGAPYGEVLLAAVFLCFIARIALGPAVRPLAFALGAVAPLVLFVGLWVGVPWVNECVHRRSFDSVAWKNPDFSDHSRTTVRLCMVDDLVDRGALDGKDRAQVADLLGPDDRERRPGLFDDWDLLYWLGPTPVFPVDDEWLVVRFGPDGRVKEYRVVND